MKARVYKSTGSWYVVKPAEAAGYASDGYKPADASMNARILGKFKIDGLKSTNPIAVGDIVEIDTDSDLEQNAIITKIYDRNNYITRISPANKHQHHIIASNLDQTLLFATLREPKTSQGFIDRFLVSAESFHIPAIIVFNKCDLFRKKEEEQFKQLKGMYENIGYTVKKISVITGEGMDELKHVLNEKITLLSGHSGVGKSSFLNKIFPGMQLKTQDVSGWSGKGLHTTTFAEMFDIPGGGKIIDTPGIRELGLVDIPRQELSHYFPEMRNLLHHCQFNNCLHTNEPNCAVKTAVEEGEIEMDRYLSYCAILDSIEDTKY
ncbi:MAG: ribosome small subunit-dependent GTPase A [Bacteroidetes bacterium]|nr:ribosome small subunit-dependent GTPase A [Bacteroidota bacterium]